MVMNYRLWLIRHTGVPSLRLAASMALSRVLWYPSARINEWLINREVATSAKRWHRENDNV